MRQAHDKEADGAQILVEYHDAEPIDLLGFSTALEALAPEHQGLLRTTRPGLDINKTPLEPRSPQGAIILELAAVSGAHHRDRGGDQHWCQLC